MFVFVHIFALRFVPLYIKSHKIRPCTYSVTYALSFCMFDNCIQIFGTKGSGKFFVLFKLYI